MANRKHLEILKQGVGTWNQWREDHPNIHPDLQKADLRKAELSDVNFYRTNLSGADLLGAVLSRANLVEANLNEAILIGAMLSAAKLGNAQLCRVDSSWANYLTADLSRADLSGAIFIGVDFRAANFSEANLRGANLQDTDLRWANLQEANLNRASLISARLVETNLERANLSNCFVYGISAWSLKLNETEQSNLVITRDNEPQILVDNLEVAQLIHLLLNSEKIRDVIDTIATKVVLILGRFTPDRKSILDALRDALRVRNYLPVLFDWDKPISRDFIETVSTLAHLARFVIADVTDPKIVLEELPHIVRNVAVPVKPLMLKGAGDEPVTLYDLRINHRSVLPTYRYKDINDLLVSLDKKIIYPTEIKLEELLKIRLKSL